MTFNINNWNGNSIYYNHINLKYKEQLGSDKPASYDNQVNYADGLSKTELQGMDKNNDGIVTEEEYKRAAAGYGYNLDKISEMWNKSLGDFELRVNDSNIGAAASDEPIAFLDGDEYYDPDKVKTALNSMLNGSGLPAGFGDNENDGLNRTEFQKIMNKKFPNADPNGHGYFGQVFDKLTDAYKSETLGVNELAAFFAISDNGAGRLSRGYSSRDGKFSEQDIKDTVRMMLNSDSKETGVYALDRSAVFLKSIVRRQENGAAYNQLTPEQKKAVEDAKEAVTDTKTAKNQALNYESKMLSSLKTAREEEISMYKKLIEACTDETLIEQYRNKITEIRGNYQSRINEKEKDYNTKLLENEINVLTAQYELSLKRNGKEGGADKTNAFKAALTKLNLNEKLNSFINAEDLAEGGQGRSNLETALKDIAKNAEALIKEYPQMKIYITSFMNTCMSRIKTAIDSSCEYKAAMAKDEYKAAQTDAYGKMVKKADTLAKFNANLETAEKNIDDAIIKVTNNAARLNIKDVNLAGLNEELNNILSMQNTAEKAEALKTYLFNNKGNYQTILKNLNVRLNELTGTEKTALNTFINYLYNLEDAQKAYDKAAGSGAADDTDGNAAEELKQAGERYIDVLYGEKTGINTIKEEIKLIIEKQKKELDKLKEKQED